MTRAAPPRILAINAGSSSLKWTLFATPRSRPPCISLPWRSSSSRERREQFAALLKNIGHLDAVGHRVVSIGTQYQSPMRLTKAVRHDFEQQAASAPLHLHDALAAINAVREVMPEVPQILLFDSHFHDTLPEAASIYALPREWTRRWQLRRQGFHGLSIQWAVQRTRQLLHTLPQRIIVCHLGSGCSVTAIEHGRSIDTSMGYSTLEGPAMGTRSGSVDPGLLLQLLIEHRITAKRLRKVLHHDSGLLGLSGVSGDIRLVQQAASAGVAEAQSALDHFIWTLRRSIGAMCGVLGGVDALVFTGGIGEHQPAVRAALTQAIQGGEVDAARNAQASSDAVISTPQSTVKVLVVQSREDRVMLSEMLRVLRTNAP